jgi:hypothetical protein
VSYLAFSNARCSGGSFEIVTKLYAQTEIIAGVTSESPSNQPKSARCNRWLNPSIPIEPIIARIAGISTAGSSGTIRHQNG